MRFELVYGYVSYRFFPFENFIAGTTEEQIFVCDFTFEKCGVVPVELRSCSLGKAWKLSPPNRIEILPEWDSWLRMVHALHWFGISI